MKEALTAAEAARALGVSIETLRRWDRDGKIRTTRDEANRRMVARSEVERLSGSSGDSLSARNKLHGIVRHVEIEGLVATVEIDVTEPARVLALITREAAEELALRPGDAATAVVKAMSVIIEHRSSVTSKGVVMKRVLVTLVALLSLLLLVVGGSATAKPKAAAPISIFAAASLTEVFREFDQGQRYSFGGSNQLATQIRLGAPADVFASASPEFTQRLFRERLVERPVTFASNKVVLIVPKGNPAGIESVYDLRRKDVKLVIGTPAVPVGSYTRTILRRLGLSSVLSKVVSQEPDVKGVVGKVALGGADAGFVYATDVKPVADRLRAIRIPAWAQPRVRYEIAVVSGSNRKAAARAWIRKIRSPAGLKALAQAGFGR